ncbi:MAG: hypothetical protein AAGA73_00890 [Pseudomonadota bacterium]
MSQKLSKGLERTIQKGALMSKADARRAYIALGISALMVFVFWSIAIDNSSRGLWTEYLCWALVGLGLVAFVTLPPVLYGFHNRHRIEPAEDLQPHDFSQAHRAGVIGAGSVPIVKAILDWLGLGG